MAEVAIGTAGIVAAILTPVLIASVGSRRKRFAEIYSRIESSVGSVSKSIATLKDEIVAQREADRTAFITQRELDRAVSTIGQLESTRWAAHDEVAAGQRGRLEEVLGDMKTTVDQLKKDQEQSRRDRDREYRDVVLRLDRIAIRVGEDSAGASD